MTETRILKSDSAGFLIGDSPVKPTQSELSIFQRLRDDLKAFRGLLGAKKHPSEEPGSDTPSNARAAAPAAVTPATPRLRSAAGVQVKHLPEIGKVATPGGDRPIVVKVDTPVAKPQNVRPENPVVDRTVPKLDANRRPIPLPETVKPVLKKPVSVKVDHADSAGSDAVKSDSKVRDLLGDIKDKIGGAVGGSEEVDPNIKAAQEIAGVAGGALSGIKTIGGALGTVATPMISGFMNRAKPNDAPTAWFRRFYNELRGLRREESVFNRAQLRTLKEIEAKPGEGKGGGFMGMLMMLVGPLIAAIGAAITAGFGLLMKLPGMDMLAKLATKLMPAILLPKTPITQPTGTPGTPSRNTAPKGPVDPKTGLPVPDPVGGSKPVDAAKKPTLWERTKTKVSGWMGTPEVAPTVPSAPGIPGGAVGDAAESVAKKPGLLARAGKGIGGVLKRVPLLGALLAAVSIGSDVYSSETDDKTTRAEKDKNTGKAVGGGGGAIAGMMAGGAAGAKAGALVGLIGGPVGVAIGAAIGGVVGSVAGGFFGEKAGAIVGEKIGAWVADLRNSDIPGKLMAGWSAFTSTLGDGFNAILKKLGLSGAFDKAKEAYSGAKDSVVQGATAAVNYGKEKAGQAGEALKNSAVGKGASWVLDQFKGDKRKAAETAQAYSAGNIAGLDDAQTRALVASTVLTESGGGKLDEVNKQGYMGRYQAGASWLSSAGLMKGGDKAVKDAMKADGFSNEWKWAESGGMTRYLSKDSNWVDGMSRSKYLASAGAQDAAFKTVNDKTYSDLLKRGVIKPGDSPEVVAGYLKTAHIAGAGGAVAVSKGGQGASDANGTSARKYFDDVAGDRHGFNQAFKNAGQAPVTATPAAPAIPATPATTTVVTAGARAIPQMPSMSVELPKIPDMQPVTQGLARTLAGGQEQRPSVIVVGNKTPVGRDLSNRPLAHIVTGGLSGGGQG
jgi:hypothetical protein